MMIFVFVFIFLPFYYFLLKQTPSRAEEDGITEMPGRQSTRFTDGNKPYFRVILLLSINKFICAALGLFQVSIIMSHLKNLANSSIPEAAMNEPWKQSKLLRFLEILRKIK